MSFQDNYGWCLFHNKLLVRPDPRVCCYWPSSPREASRNTFYHVLHPVYLGHQKKPKSPSHHLSPRHLSPSSSVLPYTDSSSAPFRSPASCPGPHFMLTWVQQHLPTETFPITLSNTTVQVPFLSPYPALYFSCTLLLSMYFSLSTVYFPHNSVNWCKLLEGKDCSLLNPWWPAQYLVHVKFSIDISCMNRWEVHNNFNVSF